MSETKYANIETQQEMIGRYFEEQELNLRNSIFLPEEYKKIGNHSFLTAFPVGDGVFANICVTAKLEFIYFIKDKRGFRFDISEREFRNFVPSYADALSSLRDKINNGMYLEKFILNENTLNKINSLLDMEQEIKYTDMDYDDYEYVAQ